MAAIIIDAGGSFYVKVRVMEEIRGDQGREKRIKEEATFKVSRHVLIENSSVFKAALRTDAFREGTPGAEYSLEGDSTKSVEIWLRAIHGHMPTVAIDLKEVWRVIEVCDKYDFAINMLNDWFGDWFKYQPLLVWLHHWEPTAEYQDKNQDPRCLLFPCWRFDNAKAFLQVTKYLIYNCAFHVTEANPINGWQLHMPSRIIQQLNAARGRLKTIVSNPIYAPIKELLKNRKSCCDKTACDYQRALLATGAWPHKELGNKKSMRYLLDKLTSFQYEPDATSCMKCKSDYKTLVLAVVARARNYVDGLCLDCMDASKAKLGNSDLDYWGHNTLEEDEYVYGCRVAKHGQPTWYFSFMERKEERDRFRKEKFGKGKATKATNGIQA